MVKLEHKRITRDTTPPPGKRYVYLPLKRSWDLPADDTTKTQPKVKQTSTKHKMPLSPNVDTKVPELEVSPKGSSSTGTMDEDEDLWGNANDSEEDARPRSNGESAVLRSVRIPPV